MRALMMIALLVPGLTWASEGCDIRTIGDKTYVMPAYSVVVNYTFDNEEEKGYALVKWAFDEDTTSTCMRASKGILPRTDLTEMKVAVLGGLEPAKMRISPQLGGQWHGDASLEVDFKSKSAVKEAIKKGEKISELKGDLKARFSKRVRDVVAKVSCQGDRKEISGVIALHKRLGEMVELLIKRDPKEKVEQDVVLEEFLGSCVEFKDVDAQSLIEFENVMRKKVKIKEADLPVMGEVTKDFSEKVSNATSEKATFFE